MNLSHPKESEITLLVKLYSRKQKLEQTFRDSNWRIQITKKIGYRRLRKVSYCCVQERTAEKGIDDCLTHLINRILDKVFRLIKKEKGPNDDFNARELNVIDEVDTQNEIRDFKKRTLKWYKSI